MANAVWTGRAVLGEGPLWSPLLKRVLFVDIRGGRLHSWSPEDNSTQSWPFPEGPCWIIERADGDGFILGLKQSIRHLRFDASGEPVIAADLDAPETDRPGNRFNDGKADAHGHVFFGSMDDAEVEPLGSLYRLDPDGRVTAVDTGYVVSNGPAVSADGKTLYHTDSAARTIYAFDLAADGSLSGKRVHIRFTEADGYPDGMTVDAEGGLWVAHWDGSRVSRFHPDGSLDRAIAVPCSRVTSCVFFGPDLDRMAITSAAHERPDEPLAGSLFVVDPGVRGLPAGRFG